MKTRNTVNYTSIHTPPPPQRLAFLRYTLATLSLTLCAALSAAVPEITTATMSQDSSRLVTITYSLAEGPAVVTVDIETNATDGTWASIGGANIQKMTGDVWKQVETGDHTITWRPDQSWPDHKIAEGGARAVVTAWALDNTPDYMVVDISAKATANSQTYYPTVEFLPGGLLGNDDYRTSKIVMRKIMAKNVTWTMGSTALETQRQPDTNFTTFGYETTHTVTLDSNYYIGVFPVTQAQWALIQTKRVAPSYFNNAADRAMRPVEKVSYNEIRNAANATAAVAEYNWPNDPNPNSFLGLLNARTGLDFDLPSEAQWEFAARAGNGATKWGDGSGIMNTNEDANLDKLGRYVSNGGYVDGTAPAQDCDASNGTAIVGSYAPNDWGLYDTAGNVYEFCLDWYQEDISDLGGIVNINRDTPANTYAGVAGKTRVKRGGNWRGAAGYARPACRGSASGGSRDENNLGFRLVCGAGLQ